LVVLLALAGAAAYWLTRRPLTYAARQGAPEELPPAPTALDPSPRFGVPDGGPAGAVASAPDPGGDALTADAGVAEEDAPIVLPATLMIPPRPTPGPRPAFHRTSNVLLVGVDRRPPAAGGAAPRRRPLGRADTLILAVFDDATGHVGFVSIPRDLYVDIPGYGAARINAAMRVGVKLHKDPLVVLRDVTSTALAVPIQDVLAVDTEMFEQGIDRLGGVTVDVPCPIEDNFIDPRTPTGRRPLRVLSGRHRMDGVTAAMYARSRHGRSDWDRARRQQALLSALRERAGELGVDAWLPIALDTIGQAVTTTMTRLEMLRLAHRAAGIQRDKMHGVVIGTRQTQVHWTEDRRAVLVPDYAAIDAQLAVLFRAPSPGRRPEGKKCPDADVAIP
jgi:LCP family protein required for cell wall assembly